MVTVKVLFFKSDICHCLKMMLYYIAITIYIVSSLSYVATSQKVGELCTMKNGLIGICQHLVDCSDTLIKSVNGQPPVICNFDSDLPVVCCAENVRFQPLREPASENNQRAYNREAVYRYPRQEQPWWLAENPFVENKHQTTTRKPDSSESLDSPWWLQENPFHPPESKPVILPPTIPPSPVRQTPPPITTKPQHPQTTREAMHPQRISEIKCNEYSKLAVDQVSALPLIPSPDLIPIDVPKCDFSKLELIVGGEETSPKEFPHMAALGYKEGGNLEWRCGGSLISEYYVLTAAHCTPNKNPPIIARLGELNLKRNDDEAQPVNYAIVERIRHPDYKPPAKYNDIALLKLDRKVEFNDFIRPACLYTRSSFDVNKTVATGWGQIDFAERQSDILLKVAISIIDNKQCNDLYKMDSPRELSRGIQPSMMCAGELRGGKDTCQGDSGGPIQITRPNNQCVYNIIGVTSYGKICAAKNSLGIYTRVSAFVPWIESIVWPDQ